MMWKRFTSLLKMNVYHCFHISFPASCQLSQCSGWISQMHEIDYAPHLLTPASLIGRDSATLIIPSICCRQPPMTAAAKIQIDLKWHALMPFLHLSFFRCLDCHSESWAGKCIDSLVPNPHFQIFLLMTVICLRHKLQFMMTQYWWKQSF